MKKALIIIIFLILFILIYFLQSNFFSWYNISNIEPNLFIVFVLSIGLYLGRIYGFSIGIVFGLLLDLFIGKGIGTNGIMLSIAGLIGGILDRNFSKENRITFMALVGITTLFCETINYTMQIIMFGAEADLIKFLKIVSIEAIYNIILVIILYPLIQKFGKKTEEIFSEKKILMRYY